MEQVVIFTQGSSNEFEDLENRVNQWLGDNEGIEIVSRQIMGAAGINREGGSYVNCTIVIFYGAPASDSPDTCPAPLDVNTDDPDEELDSSV